MGYITTFDGMINLGELSDARLKLIRKRLEQLGLNDADTDYETMYVEKDRNRKDGDYYLHVHMEMKNYYAYSEALFQGFEKMPGDNTMVEILQRLAPLFPHDAEGEIYCDGEESEDFWKIEVKGQKILVYEGKMSFELELTLDPPEAALNVAEQLLLRGGKK